MSSIALATVPFLLSACAKKGKQSQTGALETPPPPTQPEVTTEPQTSQTPGNENQDPPPAGVQEFVPKYTPPRIAIAIPGALNIGVDGAGLRLQGMGPDSAEDDLDPVAYPAPDDQLEASAPTKDESHGASELTYQMESLRSHLEIYSRELAALDKLLEEHAEDCFGGDTGCTLEPEKVEYTEEMAAKAVQDLGGEDSLSAEAEQKVTDDVGEDISLGTVTVSKSADAEFTWVVSMDHGNGRTLTVSWLEGEDSKGKKIYPHVLIDETSSGSWEFAEEDDAALQDMDAMPMPAVQTYEISYRLEYREAEGSMLVIDDSKFNEQQFKNTFFFKIDAESKANGAGFAVDMTYSGLDVAQTFTKINGYADNHGAYLQTLYAFDNVETELTLNDGASPEPGVYYEIFPQGTLAADLKGDDLSLGTYWQGGVPEDLYVSYWGPEKASGLSLPLFKPNYDEEDMISFTATGMSVIAATSTTTRSVSGYTESYLVEDGALKGDIEYCWYSFTAATLEWPDDAQADFCSSGWGDDSAYSDEFYDNVGDNGLAKIGFIEVGLAGAFDWNAIQGAPLYFLKIDPNSSKSAQLAALTAAWNSNEASVDANPFEQILGVGDFVGEADGDYAALSGADVNPLYVFNAWGDVDELQDAFVARLIFDENSGVASFQEVSGASVVAREVTEENMDQSFDEFVEAKAL